MKFNTRTWSRLTAAAVAALILGSTGAMPVLAQDTPLPDEQQNLAFVPNYGVPSLDSAMVPLEQGTNQIMLNVLQSLVYLDENSIPQPLLATSWEWVTPTQLQFKLREGVTFSDGKPFTAADVVGSFDRYIEKKATLAAALSIIESYQADDDYTFTVNTTAPTGTIVGVLSLIKIGQGEFSKDDTWWAKPIGTGPFVIADYVPNSSVTLTRNETYWGEEAKLKTLTFNLITDTNAKITALANGQVQALGNVVYDQLENVKSMSDVSLIQADGLVYAFLWFNNEAEPLNDPKVRRTALRSAKQEVDSDARQTSIIP